MKVTKLTCRVCKKKFESSGSSTCSDACFEASKNELVTWEDRKTRRYIRVSKKLKDVRESIELSPANKKKLERLLARQAQKYNVHRERAIQRLKQGTVKKVVKRVVDQNKSLTKKIRALKQGREPNGFYETEEWQQLRYRVLRTYGRKCMLCGATNCELHVDHIKPRSKYPELSLAFDNLQVLCRLCNLGKSNLDDTDWRPSA